MVYRKYNSQSISFIEIVSWNLQLDILIYEMHNYAITNDDYFKMGSLYRLVMVLSLYHNLGTINFFGFYWNLAFSGFNWSYIPIHQQKIWIISDSG